MKGAAEYAALFGAGQHQYGKIVIFIGQHARGYTCNVFVLKDDMKIDNIFAHSEKVEVYGITGGHSGWTETYGWLHCGPWQQDFADIVDKLRRKRADEKQQIEQNKSIRDNTEATRIQSILSLYERAR